MECTCFLFGRFVLNLGCGLFDWFWFLWLGACLVSVVWNWLVISMLVMPYSLISTGRFVCEVFMLVDLGFGLLLDVLFRGWWFGTRP